jgi:hypothetical protein
MVRNGIKMNGYIQTSVATERSSAPVVLGHNLAIKSKRIPRSTLILDTIVNGVTANGYVWILTCEHEFVECVLVLHYQANQIRLVDPAVQVAIRQDPGYRV